MTSWKETGDLVSQYRPQGEPAPDLCSSAFSMGLKVLPGGPGTGQEHGTARCLLPAGATATILANTFKVMSPAALCRARTPNREEVRPRDELNPKQDEGKETSGKDRSIRWN